jgi:cation-transporting ATPase E
VSAASAVAGGAAAGLPSAANPDLAPTPPTGLTLDEVARRRAAGQGNDVEWRSGRTYWQIVRENVFVFINNIMFLLGVALVLVGRPFDALISVAVVSTNIFVSVVQEIRAKKTLDQITLLTRPTATVIRDGATTTVPPEQLVLGDLVSITAGDQVVLDGRLVHGRLQADESQLTGESDLLVKLAGDQLFSGSFCASGGGRYVVERVRGGSLANHIAEGARSFRRVLTPLQLEINKVIRVALLIVIYMELLLVINSVVKLIPAGDAVGHATVLAGLIPSGLFVSIAVAYALGAVRLVRFGALIQQANAVESLSHVDILCTDKTGTLTANRLAVTELLPVDGDVERFRKTLGMVVASAGERNKTAEAIASACPGEVRPTLVDVPFSSARKWSGLSTSDGSFALGAPQFLRPALARLPDDQPGSWASLEPQIAEYAGKGMRVLMVAVHPDPGAIVGQDDDARLADGFFVMGLVILEDELRPEAGAILNRFIEAGVRLKIISGDDPDTVVALARQAGVAGELPSISGVDIEGMDDAQLAAAAARVTVFGRITPQQKERLVGALRASGGYVAMIGDGVNDVLSLKKANLAVAMASGSQATRSVADIVLTNDSFAALAPAVEEGQRILNGMFDILSLFLARVATMGLVILSSLVIGLFPIALRNASAITLFSVGIPAALLAIWAQPGQQARDTIGRTIVRFVVPAAMLTSLAGLIVLYGTLALEILVHTPGGGLSTAERDALVTAATPVAQSALTVFLVMAGLALVVFVEPPNRWLAVVQAQSRDRRPTLLAIALAVTFVILVVVEPLRGIFALEPPGLAATVLIAVSLLVWFLGLRWFWSHRVIERFVGA